MNSAEIRSLLALEWRLDRRQKYAWGSMALYVVSTIYVCYLGVKRLDTVALWNALFWIIMVFAAFNALQRSFQREDQGRQIYLYTLVHPRSVILARTLYNALTMVVLALVSLGAYALFLGTDLLRDADPFMFLTAVVLGGTGLALALTLISAIAARAGSGIGLMAILGFPIILPLLIALMRASKLALDGVAWSVTGKYFVGLLALDVITVALAWVLYPYIWRD